MELVNARSIFSPANGFIRRGGGVGFDWTCNPYTGCTFGCLYCYAMFLPQNHRPVEDWGRWLEAKKNAVELARKEARKLRDQAVFISSVTDPYLPLERSLLLTRGILEALVPYQPWVVIQTRSPGVIRDIDVLSQFDAVRVNMSIPTDSEDMRKRFEPKAPPLERRWEAVAEVKASGLPVGICVTPMLPLADPEAFAARLAAFQADVVVTQDFHDRAGGFGANTGAVARELLAECGWTTDAYRRCLQVLRRQLHVCEGEEGFFPPEPRRPARTVEVTAGTAAEEPSTDEQVRPEPSEWATMRKLQHYPDDAVVVPTYVELGEYVGAFAQGHLSLLILIGPAGVQKSTIVREAVGPEGCWIEGHVTPLGMYCQLYKHRDQFVVIDDVNDLYAHPAAVRLLKCLCQTERVKRIAWTSLLTALGQHGIPEEFTTASRVAIIANEWRTLSENVGALQDRGHVLFFEPSPLEVHVRTAAWFADQEIFDFIGAHLHLIGKPSMRHYLRARELKSAGMDWQKGLLSQWLSGPALMAAQVLADPSYGSEEERAQAFEARGGGCRATFFGWKKKLHPPQQAPRMVLPNGRRPAVPGEFLDRLRRRGHFGPG